MKKIDNPTFFNPSEFIFPLSNRYDLFKSFHRSIYFCIIKRINDLILGSLFLIITLPIFLVFALLIKLDSRGPVFYKQKRSGLYNKHFFIYKFRSMYDLSEINTGPVWTTENDLRVTKTGRFLRRFHLDELPQLLNIIKGDMSLVGPRPERPYFIKKLSQEFPAYFNRLKIQPGLTGWAQINQSYDKDVEDVGNKLDFDLYYIDHLSFWFDFKILLRSVLVVLSGKGI